jgi:hypothetical protein
MPKPTIRLGNSKLMNELIAMKPASTVNTMKYTANAVIIHAVKNYYDHSMLVLDAKRSKCYAAVDKQQEESKASCFDTYGEDLISNHKNMSLLSDPYNKCIAEASSYHTGNITACDYDFGNATATLIGEMEDVTKAHLFEVN